MGFIDSFKKGWAFLKAALAMARDNRKLLAPSVYQVVITIAYFAAWGAALVAIDPQWSDGTWAAVGALATFGSFLIFYLCSGMTVHMIDAHLRGEQPTLAAGARDARKNFFAIVVLALISTVVDVLARGARNNNSLFGKVIASIVETIWTMVSFLLLPAIMLEDTTVGGALRRVRALHKGNMLLIGIGEIGVRLVTSLIGAVWLLAIFGIIYGALELVGGTPALVIAFMVGGTLFALFAAFSTYLRVAYYTCLYMWARDVERAGEQAPAPLPLAIALGRRGGRA
jgi:hypothetical protein